MCENVWAIYAIGLRFLSLSIHLIPNTGFNPLIYTISVAAVVVLGTLAIVAIITCWIRARRSYNRRMFQSSGNPRDHLNYISDNDSTPLTTSELLQERSPTFHVGEENQGQMRPEGGDDDMETSNSSNSSNAKSSSVIIL